MVERVIAGRYQLIEKIGVGGMGTVWRATDAVTGGHVAVKLLKPELTADKEQIERFSREAEALRRLNHPNIVQVLATVDDPDSPALVMELVPGGSLDAVLHDHAAGGLPIRQIVSLALELTDALTRAHHLGIIHRDIKPGNVLLAADRTPRLSDFGVARIAAQNDMTGTGAIIGTLDYLSPEGLQGSLADARTDLWAFGVLLFELLTGKRPFDKGNPGQTVLAIMTEATPDLEALRPDLPVGLVDVVYRLLTKDPAERLSSARQLGVELEAVLNEIATGTTRRVAVQPRAQVAPMTQPIETVRQNLPVQATPFIGREAETVALRSLMKDPITRLITITAPGGMGKTRLALAVAESVIREGAEGFSDGVWFVGLAPITQPDQIAPTLGGAIGFVFGAGGTPEQQLVDYLRAKHLLLVIDNFEHVMAGSPFISALLDVSPGLKLLITSRERLNLRGETVYTLDGLDFPDWETPADAMRYAAVQLFTTSARRAHPAFELRADDLQYVARICRLVLGMPLGIELAAAWAAVLPPADIATEIQTSLDFLESDSRDMPERHRSLRAAFEYSWALMTGDERDIFMQMSVFRGKFSRVAAQTVTGASLKVLMALNNKSLLKRDPDSGAYTLHELLRQYGEARLVESGHIDGVRQKHAEYYLGWLSARRADFEGARQADSLREADAQQDNLRAAWLWAAALGRHDLITLAFRAVYILYDLRGRNVEMGLWVDESLSSLQKHPTTPERTAVLKLLMTWRAESLASLQYTAESKQKYAEAIAIRAEDAGDELWATTAVNEGFMATMNNQQAHGRALIEQAIERFERSRDRWGAAWAHANLGRSHWFRQAQVNVEASLQHLRLALDGFRQLGDRYSEAAILMNIATITDTRYDPSFAAEPMLLEAIVLYRQLGNKAGLSSTLNNLILALVSVGRCDDAIRYVPEMVGIRRDLGRPVMLLWGLFTGGFALINAGKLTDGLATTEEGLAIARALPSETLWYQNMLWLHGMCAMLMGDTGRAVTALRTSVERSHVNRELIYMPTIAHGLILALYIQGDFVVMRQALAQIQADLTPPPDLNSAAMVQMSEGVLLLAEGKWAEAKVLLDVASAHLTNRSRWQPSYVWEPYVANSYACEVEAWRTWVALQLGDDNASALAASCLEQAVIADTVYAKGFACISMIRLAPHKAGAWFGHLRAHPEYGAFILTWAQQIWSTLTDTAVLEHDAQRGETLSFSVLAKAFADQR